MPGEMSLTGSLSAQPPDMDRLLELFSGPNSSELYERHLAAIERLCKTNSLTGFAIRDLPKVQQILELTLKLLASGNAEFLKPAEDLIRVLSRPFVKKTSTDDVRLLGNIANVLACVGQVFTTFSSYQSLQLAVSGLLFVFASGYGNRPNVLDSAHQMHDIMEAGSGLRQYHQNQSLIRRSGVVRDVVRGLTTAILAADEVVMMSLTIALNQFSYAPDNAIALLDAGVLACLPHVLSYDYKHPITAVAVELLWNLLEMAPAPTRAALAAPQPLLTQLLRGNTHVERATVADEASAPVAAENGPSAPSEVLHPADGVEVHAVAFKDQAVELSQEGVEPPQTDQPDPLPQELQHQQSNGAYVVTALAQSLSGLFRSLLLNGFRAVDKELRNDVLVVINLILGSDHDISTSAASADAVAAVDECGAAFANVAAAEGLFQAVLAVATTPELGAGEHEGIVKPWAVSTEDLDYEMKQLAWRAAVTGCLHQGISGSATQEATRWGLMHVLLAFVEMLPEVAPQSLANAAAVAVQRWPADELAALRSAALSRLFTLAPLLPEAYLAEDGPGVLLRFLSACVNPCHVEGGLRHLHRLVTAAPEMAEALGAAGALRVLLGLLQDGARSDGTRHYCLLLLTSLCRVNGENMRRLRHDGGVAVLLAQLARACAMDATLPSPFVVTVLDALWACVVPDRKNAARFLVEDGLDGLLHLLEAGNRGHRAVVLSVLCDLLENPRAHPFFHEWRSARNQQTAAHLLLKLWGEEDALRGITTDGLLTNTQHPLAGTGKVAQWVPAETISYGGLLESRRVAGSPNAAGSAADTRGAAVAAMLAASSGEAVLAKLYGCFRLLGFANFGYLAPADAAQLTLVEKYVKFKQGEVWHAISAECAATGMRPTAADRERLASGIELAEHLARAVRGAQGAILGRELAAQQAKEAKFFEDMRAQKKLEQEARFYQKDKSQLTVAEVREAKAKKEAMLRSSIRDFKVMDDNAA